MCQRSQLKQLLSTQEPTSEESPKSSLVALTNSPIFAAGTRTSTSSDTNHSGGNPSQRRTKMKKELAGSPA